MGVGAQPKKWEGTGWGVVSEEEPGWTVLFCAQLLRFFCPLHTRWVHSKAQAPPLPAPRDGAEEGRYYLKLCFGVAVTEDTGGDSEFLYPASPRAFAGAAGGGGRRGVPRDGRCPSGPRQDHVRTLEHRFLVGNSASLPPPGDGEQRVGVEGLCGPPRGHQLAESEPRRAAPTDGQRGRHGSPLEHRRRPMLRAPAR